MAITVETERRAMRGGVGRGVTKVEMTKRITETPSTLHNHTQINSKKYAPRKLKKKKKQKQKKRQGLE